MRLLLTVSREQIRQIVVDFDAETFKQACEIHQAKYRAQVLKILEDSDWDDWDSLGWEETIRVQSVEQTSDESDGEVNL